MQLVVSRRDNPEVVVLVDKQPAATGENPAAALVHAQSCLSTLQQIRKENPNAIKPTEGSEGKDVDSLIKTVEGIIGSLELLIR